VNEIRVSTVLAVASVLASTGLVLGCYATVQPAPVEATYEDVADDGVVYGEPPPRIDTYPVVIYRGAPHYYVNGRWYYRSSRGWGYYRDEPAPLARRRPVIAR